MEHVQRSHSFKHLGSKSSHQFPTTMHHFCPAPFCTALGPGKFPRVVKLSRTIHSLWCSSVNFFNFHSCEHTIPRARTLRFLPAHCCQCACRHLLLLELLRYLITFDTPAFVLDHRNPTRASLSPRSVHQGSWHFISRPGILCSPSVPPTR